MDGVDEQGLIDQCGGVFRGVERRHGDAVEPVLGRAEAVDAELALLDVGEHARDLAAEGAVRVASVVVAALAVDVGEAGDEGEEADRGEILTHLLDLLGLSRVDDRGAMIANGSTAACSHARPDSLAPTHSHR